LSAYSEDDASLSEEDSRMLSDDDDTLDSYHNKKKKGSAEVTKTSSSAISENTDNSSYISNDYTETTNEDRGKKNDDSTLGYPSEDDESTLPEDRKHGRRAKVVDDNVSHHSSDIPASDVPSLLSKPLASSFAKRCYFTKAGIGKTAQHYEGLTLTGNTVLMLSAAMKLKGCPTICDEDLRRVEQTYPNQFSRLPDELLLSSGWRRISKYCHFSNKPIPDGVPFFHSKQRIHPQGGYYFLLAAAVGMVRPIDVEPLTMDTLIVLQTDYPSQCDNAPEPLISDPSIWILVDKFCFFSGGPINTEEDVYYRADFDGNEIYMLAFLSPSLTPEELYRLGADGEVQDDLGLKSVAAVEEVESVYDLTERDFDDLKLYHLGPCRALPPFILQPNSWTKVLPPHFINARQKALDSAIEYEAVHGVSQAPVPLHYQQQQINNDAMMFGNGDAMHTPMMQHPQQQPPQTMDPNGQPIPQPNDPSSNNTGYVPTNDPHTLSGYVEFGQGQTTNDEPNMSSPASIYWQQGGQLPQQPAQQQQTQMDWNHHHHHHHQQQQEYYSQQQQGYLSQQFAPVQHNPAEQLHSQTPAPLEQEQHQQNPDRFSYFDPEVAALGGVTPNNANHLPSKSHPSSSIGMNMSQAMTTTEPAEDLVRQELQRQVEEEGAFVSPIESDQPIDEAIATRAMQHINYAYEESQYQQQLQLEDEGVKPLPPSPPSQQRTSPDEEVGTEEQNINISRLDPPVDDDTQLHGEGRDVTLSPLPPPDAPDEENCSIGGAEQSEVKTPLSPGGIVLPHHSLYVKKIDSNQEGVEQKNVVSNKKVVDNALFSTINDSNDISDHEQVTKPAKNIPQDRDDLEDENIPLDECNDPSFTFDEFHGDSNGDDDRAVQTDSFPVESTTPKVNAENNRLIRKEAAVLPLRVDTIHDSSHDDPDYSLDNDPFTPSPHTLSFDGPSFDSCTKYGNDDSSQQERFNHFTDYGQPLTAVRYEEGKEDADDPGYLTSPREFLSPESVGQVDEGYYDDKYYNDSQRSHVDDSEHNPTGYTNEYNSFSPHNGIADSPYSKPKGETGGIWDSSSPKFASNTVSTPSPTGREGGPQTTAAAMGGGANGVRPGSPSGFTDVSEALSTSSAMRGAQELLKKNRKKRLALRGSDRRYQEQQQPMQNPSLRSPNLSMKSPESPGGGVAMGIGVGFTNSETFSPETKTSESDWETSTEVTSVVSGSSVWTDATNPDRSSRRAFILQMAKARMKSGNNAAKSNRGGATEGTKTTAPTTATMSASEKNFEESIEKTETSFESIHTADSEVGNTADLDFSGDLD